MFLEEKVLMRITEIDVYKRTTYLVKNQKGRDKRGLRIILKKLGDKNMKKEERKQKVEATIQSDELLYQNKLTVKRIMMSDEPLHLVQSLGIGSKEILTNLTGSTGRRSFPSLIKNKNVKHCKIYGVSNRSFVNAFYTGEVNSSLLAHWQLLGQAMWFMREKGVRLGKVERIANSNDLATNMLFRNNVQFKLHIKHITEENLDQPITTKPGYTLVMVFDSFSLLQTTVTQHNNQFFEAINAGCFLISITNVQDFEVIKGLVLSINNDGESKVEVTHLKDMFTVNQVEFKQVTTPDTGTVSQLNWEYDSAITNKTNKTNQKEEIL